MWIAVSSAAVAGACFAVAGILQQREARTRPGGESLSFLLILDLAKRPLWVAGMGMALLSYGFQSLALAFGPLSLVQAVLVCEMIFAVPLSARLHHIPIGWQTWLGVLAVAGGLATAILAAAPQGGNPIATLQGWVLVMVAVAVVSGAAVLVGRRLGGLVRGSLYAFAGAVIMGSQSALLDVTITHLEQGFLPVVTSWQTYALIFASVVGMLLIQSAFQSAPVAATLPVFDCTEPAVAITIGLLLFGETIASGTGRRLLVYAGVACVLAGIWVLDTAPASRRAHEQEEGEKEGAGQDDPADGEERGAEPISEG